MSNVPRAKLILDKLLDHAEMSAFVRKGICAARALLDREQPEFKTPRKLPALTDEQRAYCRELRREGLPLNEIARKLGTNIGRVSEAINQGK